jgi:Prokaryotic dksA/traR C4-type zinc finger
MPREERANPVAVAPVAPDRGCAPRWRTLLEARWRARLRDVTELSLAYHAAAAASPASSADPAVPAELAERADLADLTDPAGPVSPEPGDGGPGPLGRQRRLRRELLRRELLRGELLRRELLRRELLCRAIVARRKLADVEEALGRLAAGTFGYCEQCESPIPDGLLAAVPERRYCPRCEAGAGPAPALSGRSQA